MANLHEAFLIAAEQWVGSTTFVLALPRSRRKRRLFLAAARRHVSQGAPTCSPIVGVD